MGNRLVTLPPNRALNRTAGMPFPLGERRRSPPVALIRSPHTEHLRQEIA